MFWILSAVVGAQELKQAEGESERGKGRSNPSSQENKGQATSLGKGNKFEPKQHTSGFKLKQRGGGPAMQRGPRTMPLIVVAATAVVVVALQLVPSAHADCQSTRPDVGDVICVQPTSFQGINPVSFLFPRSIRLGKPLCCVVLCCVLCCVVLCCVLSCCVVLCCLCSCFSFPRQKGQPSHCLFLLPLPSFRHVRMAEP